MRNRRERCEKHIEINVFFSISRDENMQNDARTDKEQTKSRGTKLTQPFARSVRPLFGKPRPVMFDITISPRRQHTPTMQVELPTPDVVKRYVDEVMDGWMRTSG
jgi:hypothetical protein